MPLCKNDRKRHYKGTEPSPKGRGYCAHAEKIGARKIGRDRNMWIVKRVSNGSRRWIKLSSKKRRSTTKRKSSTKKRKSTTKRRSSTKKRGSSTKKRKSSTKKRKSSTKKRKSSTKKRKSSTKKRRSSTGRNRGYMIRVVLDEKVKEIYVDDKKIKVKDYGKYFTLPELEKAIYNSDLGKLTKYMKKDKYKDISLFGVPYLKNKTLYVMISAMSKKSGKNISDSNIKELKQFMKGQISDGWGENGTYVNGATVFL